jgi:HSP20 family protein
MTYVTLRPPRGLADLQDEMSRIMRDVFEDGPSDRRGALTPPVEIVETEGEVLLHADLPGVERESIDVSVDNRVLSITATREPREPATGETPHRSELSFGQYSRSFNLPTTVDAGRITAEYVDGVLRVTLPKAEAARPRRVEVRAG